MGKTESVTLEVAGRQVTVTNPSKVFFPEKQERQGQGGAPWPPHYEKQPSEPRRVQPSKRKKQGPEGER